MSSTKEKAPRWGPFSPQNAGMGQNAWISSSSTSPDVIDRDVNEHVSDPDAVAVGAVYAVADCVKVSATVVRSFSPQLMPVRVGANTDCEYPLPAALVDTPPAPNAGMVNVNTGAQVVVPAVVICEVSAPPL